MKSKWAFMIVALLLLALAVGPGQAQGPEPPGQGTEPQGEAGIQAALGTAFTYQGQLKSGGNPVNGNCDFQFSLYDAASGGAPVGSTQTKTNVSVSNGLFTTSLDFGSAFTGDARWLAIAVRCPAGSGSYTTLSPRQALTAAPYALGLRPGAYIQGSVGLGGVVMGDNTSTSPLGAGVWGTSAGGIGVYGKATATSGTTSGVWGESNNPEGRGVYGVNTSSGTGVAGISSTGDGVRGESSGANKSGVYGVNTNSSGFGVYGRNTGAGTIGYLGGFYGVYGESASTAGAGVVGYATATSGYTSGVYGESDSTAGVGVFGYAYATSGYTYGVWGQSASTDGYAGYFAGRVHVTGNFSAGGSKAFKIDHPLDPANRYLYHFAQEGPEVQNVYNGVVTLDASGQALVALPAYFEALNAGPYRYQLTPIGAPMPNLYIAQEIQGHTFRIAGGVPGKKVSWEVTAVRHDPYLRDHPVQAEVDKPAEEQGTYLYPQGYGQPKEMGLDYQRNAALLERMPESPSAEGGE